MFGANLAFTPFATWAGDVSVAVGAEYRKEKISGFVPDEFQPLPLPSGATQSLWSVGNYRPSKGSYNVKEAYLETVVPLGFGLEFNGAVAARRLFDIGLCHDLEARWDLASRSTTFACG